MRWIGLVMAFVPALACAATVQPATAPASASTAQTASVLEFLKQNAQHFKGYTRVYHDAHGKVIDRSTFVRRAGAGQQYNAMHDTDKHLAVYTLLPPGDMPKTDLTGGIKVKPGHPLPSFRERTVDGHTLTEASLRGKPTLINFYFSDCVPCIAEVTDLNAYARQHPRIRVLAVTFDDAATARRFVARHHFAWPVVYGAMPLIKRIGVRTFPLMVLLDARGQLVQARISPALKSKGNQSDAPTAGDINRWVSVELTGHAPVSGH